jgi:hypothetical protein
VKVIDDVEYRGVMRELHCCIEGRWGGKATTLNPMVVVEEQEGSGLRAIHHWMTHSNSVHSKDIAIRHGLWPMVHKGVIKNE